MWLQKKQIIVQLGVDETSAMYNSFVLELTSTGKVRWCIEPPSHKLLVLIFKKGIATLSQKLKCKLLRIHQYKVCILYKPDPDLYRLTNGHNRTMKKTKDKEIVGLAL